MNTSIELVPIRGIRIGINWSWLVVFALIVWTLATGIFPRAEPGLSDGRTSAMAVVAAVLFFASLLAHELGHALQARREGMEIEGITLWLFGGVAKFRGMFPSAGAEFRIAIAGPVGLARDRPRLRRRRLGRRPAGPGRRRRGLARLHQPDAARLQPAPGAAARRRPRPALGAVAGAAGLRLGDADRARDRRAGSATCSSGAASSLFIVEGAFSGAWLAFIGWFLLTRRAPRTRYLAGGTRSATCASAT